MIDKSAIANAVNGGEMSASMVAEYQHISYRSVCRYAYRMKIGLFLHTKPGRPKILEEDDITDLVFMKIEQPGLTEVDLKAEIVKKANENWRKRHRTPELACKPPKCSRKTLFRYCKLIKSLLES